MATYYWVGGNGTWDVNTTTNWSLSSGGVGYAGVPGSGDSVVFDSNSGGTAYAVTIGTAATCADMTASGLSAALTFTMSATSNLYVYGSMTLPATNFSTSITAGATVYFVATTTGKTITTNGVSLANLFIVFNAAGGEWTLGSALTNTGNVIYVQAGSLVTGNYNITSSGLSSGGTSTRSIALGSSTLTLSGTTSVNVTNITGLTFNAGTSTITCSNASPTFTGGGLTFYNVTFSSAAVGTVAIAGANTFNNLSFSSLTATGTKTVTFAANQTISGTLTCSSTNYIYRTKLSSSVAGTQRTITAAAVSFANTDFQDIVAAGASSPWTAPASSIDYGNNSNITFSTASTLYWIGGSGNWSDGTHWSTTSGGSAANAVPNSTTSVIFDANSNVGTGAFTVTVDGNSTVPSLCNDFSTGGTGGALDGAMTLSMGATAVLSCYGSMTFPATNFSVSATSGAAIQFVSTSTGKTLTTNGVSLGSAATAFIGIGGGWTLGSALTAFSVNVTAGTFDTGNYNMTLSANLQRSSNTGTTTITLGSSAISCGGSTPVSMTSVTGLTFNAGTSTITCSNASPTFTGGGLTFYNVTFSSTASGTATITGVNTFNNLTFTSLAATGRRPITFAANQTVSGTLTLGAANTAIRRLSLLSDINGTQRTITLNGTLATLSDVDFQDIVAAGSAGTWSGTRLGDGTNNSNITFSAPKTVYWNLSGTQNWSATGWATTNNGVPAVNNFPLAQDIATFTEAGAAGTVTIDTNWMIGSIQMADGVSNRTTAFTLATGTTGPRIYGNVTLFSNLTLTGTGTLQFAGYGLTQTVTSASKTFPQSFTINAPTGTFKIADNFTQTSATGFTLTSGTVDLNNNTLTCYLFSSSNSNTRAIAFGTSGQITVTGNNAAVWSTTPTGFTYTGTSNIVSNYSGSSGTRTINVGALSETYSLNISITSGSDIVTSGSTGAGFKNLIFSGFSGSFGANAAYFIYGNLTLSSGMTMQSIIHVLNFAATSGTQTITSNGVTFGGPLTVNAPGATVTLYDALVMNSARTLTLTAGTFDTANQNVTCGLFSATGSTARTLTLGSSTITTTGTGTTWDATTTTNLTFTPGTSSIVLASGSTMQGGGLTYYGVTVSGAAGSSTANIFGTNTFTNFTVSSPSAAGVNNVVLNANQTISGTLTANGSAVNQRCRLASATTSQTTVTAGAVSLSNASFYGILASGAAISWTGTSLGDGGNNTNITFTAPKTVYWSQAAGGNWTGANWATSSGGTPSSANFPLGQDTAIIDNAGISAASSIVIDAAGMSIGTLTASTLTNAITLNQLTNGLTVNSGLTLAAAVTVNAVSTTGFTFSNAGTCNVTFGNATLNNCPLTINAVGSLNFLDSFTTTGGITHNYGPVSISNKTVTCQSYSSSNSNTRSIAFGSIGQIILTGANATIWTTNVGSNFSYTGTSNVIASYAGSVGTRTINHLNFSGGGETNAISFNVISGSDSIAIYTYIKNLNFTGFSGTYVNSARTIYGNLTVSSGMILSPTTTQTTFAATSGTQQITTNGVTLDFPITKDGAGTLQLQDALTVGSTRTVTLNTGTLDLNNLTLTAGLFSSSNSNVRTIAFGTGNITLTANNATVLVLTTSTGLSVTGTKLFNATYSGSTGTRTFAMGSAGSGATESNVVNVSITAGADIVTITVARILGSLNFTGFAGTLTNTSYTLYGNLTTSSGMSIDAGANSIIFGATSGTQTITTNGKTYDFPLVFSGVGGTFQLQDNLTLGSTRTVTLTAGTLDLNNNTLTTGIFSSTNSNTRSIAFGTGNIIVTAGNTGLWNMGDSTGFTYTGTPTINLTYSGGVGTRTVSSGATSTGGTETNALNFNITAGTDTITFGTGTRVVKNIDFTGFLGVCSEIPKVIYGNLTLASGMTLSGTTGNVITFSATSGTKTITTVNKTIDNPITFNGIGGTWQLQDALTIPSTRTATLTSGALDLNGKALTAGSFVATGSTTRSVSFGTAGTIELTGTGTVWDASTATNLTATGTTGGVKLLNVATATFAGGGATYPTLTIGGTGVYTLSGNNTFYNIVNTTQPATITFTAGSTTTVSNFNVNGTAGNLVTLNSSVPGSQFYLVKV